MNATRESLIADLGLAGLDQFDEEDATDLVDVLLEGFSAFEVQTWLFMYDAELEGTPLVLIDQGRGRAVLARARKLIAEVSSV